MRGERLRWAAVVLFAIGAVLAGVGNQRNHRALVAIAFVCFAIGAIAFLRYRASLHARVLDREEKTPPEGVP